MKQKNAPLGAFFYSAMIDGIAALDVQLELIAWLPNWAVAGAFNL